jgi:hypothetical protein
MPPNLPAVPQEAAAGPDYLLYATPSNPLNFVRGIFFAHTGQSVFVINTPVVLYIFYITVLINGEVQQWPKSSTARRLLQKSETK